MRPFQALACALGFVGSALALGCGGSASETPFPEEPLPDYLTQKASSAVKPSGPGEPGADASNTSATQGGAKASVAVPVAPAPSQPAAPRPAGAKPAGAKPKPASAPAF